MKKQEIVEKIKEIYEGGKVQGLGEDEKIMSLVSAHHYVMVELSKLTLSTGVNK